MNKEYGPIDWNVSDLADAICNQKYIGNLLTMENDGGEEILAFNTIVPLNDIKGEFLSSFKEILRNSCPKNHLEFIKEKLDAK